MSRSSKIACAFALVFAAALAAWLWPDGNDNAVNIQFAGAATSDHDLVSFTITNRSKTHFVIKLGTLTFPSNGLWEELDITLANPHLLSGHASVTISDTINPPKRTHRWRLGVGYIVPSADSPFNRARWRLREYVHSLGWERAGQWILPETKWRYTYGPEMIGNKPAAALTGGDTFPPSQESR